MFLVAFGVSKATVFFAPLVLSNSLSESDYGTLEYAINIAFLGAAILNFGVPNAYPYFKLKRKFKNIFSGFNVHFAYLLVTCLVSLISVVLFVNKIEYVLSILFTFTLANQVNYSIREKSNENIIKAVIIDSLFYIVLIAAYLYIIISGNNSISSIVVFSSIYAVSYMLITIFKQKNTVKTDLKKHRKLVKYGVNVMVSGLLILLIANSGRLLIEYLFNDKELVAIFSFYFRMASFVLIAHQILNIVFFKKIYTFNVHKLDKYFTAFLALISLGILVTYFAVPYFGSSFFKLFESFNTYKPVYLILCFQMFFWIMLANNENIIYREGIASKMNTGFIIILLVFLGVVVVFKNKLNFFKAVLVLYFLIVLANAVQLLVLYKAKQIKLIKTTIFGLLIFIISLACILY